MIVFVYANILFSAESEIIKMMIYSEKMTVCFDTALRDGVLLCY